MMNLNTEGPTGMSKLKIFLADDQSLVRSGFRMLIDAEDDMQVVGEATNGIERKRVV